MNYLIAAFTFLFLSSNVYSQSNITTLLPDPFALPGIQLAGEPEIYNGKELVDLAGRGAEIYLEYGFVKMVSQNYSEIQANSSLRVDIYEMSDPEAAFGIFSFTAKGKKVKDKITHYIVSEKDYGMMVKGSYFIIASFANLDEDLKKDILQRIAGELNSKIIEYVELPKLQVSTQPPCRDFSQSLYFRGNATLESVVFLDFKIPFNYKEGLFYRCNIFDYMLFIPDDGKSKKEIVQETISNILKKNPDLKPISETSGFLIKENDHLMYEIIPGNNNIVLIKYF